MLSLEVFKNGLGAMIQAFPDRKFDSRVLYQFLQDLSKEEFLEGMAKVISTTTELYPGTNIIALIRKNAKTQHRLSAGEAWGEVRRQIGTVGSRGCPKFSNPLIGKAVDAVGWGDMCMSENIMVDRAHFLKIYDSLEQREKEEMAYLPSQRIKKLIHKIGK